MGFFDKLKAGLRRTKSALFGTVEEILRAFVRIDEDLFEELEEASFTLEIMSPVAMLLPTKYNPPKIIAATIASRMSHFILYTPFDDLKIKEDL